jgi:hypothetical protein
LKSKWLLTSIFSAPELHMHNNTESMNINSIWKKTYNTCI